MELAPVLWSPEGFEDYRTLYPRTGPLDPPPDRSWSSRFADLWQSGTQWLENALSRYARDTSIVFVRGFLGHCMPGSLLAPLNALRRLGFDAFIADNDAGGTLAGNVTAVDEQLRAVPLREHLILCGHSRGGLECLYLAASHRHIAERCRGVALSQTAHGPSYILDSVLLGLHRGQMSARGRVAEAWQRAALFVTGATPGARELTSAAWPQLVRAVDGNRWPFRILQTASWSSRPTGWLDSFHARLGEIAPGRAHDGQFFLEDLVWPGLAHILLPRVDHVQPVLGGNGFDHTRYWLCNLYLLLR